MTSGYPAGKENGPGRLRITGPPPFLYFSSN